MSAPRHMNTTGVPTYCTRAAREARRSYGSDYADYLEATILENAAKGLYDDPSTMPFASAREAIDAPLSAHLSVPDQMES